MRWHFDRGNTEIEPITKHNPPGVALDSNFPWVCCSAPQLASLNITSKYGTFGGGGLKITNGPFWLIAPHIPQFCWGSAYASSWAVLCTWWCCLGPASHNASMHLEPAAHPLGCDIGVIAHIQVMGVVPVSDRSGPGPAAHTNGRCWGDSCGRGVSCGPVWAIERPAYSQCAHGKLPLQWPWPELAQIGLVLGFYLTWLLPPALLRQTKPPVIICDICQIPERMA